MMPKHTTNENQDNNWPANSSLSADDGDDWIGLTEAFSPVSDDDFMDAWTETSADMSVDEMLDDSENTEFVESVDEMFDDSLNTESDNPFDETVGELIDEMIDESENTESDEPADEPAEETIDESENTESDEPADDPTEEMIDESDNTESDEPADDPTEETIDKSENTESDEPADEPTDDLADVSINSAASSGAHAGGFSYVGDNDAEYPGVFESLEPHPEPPILFDDVVAVAPEQPSALHEKGDKEKKKKKKKKDEIPPYLRKSRRVRKLLIVVVILLIALVGALGYFTFKLIEESQLLATQQTLAQQGVQEVEAIQQEDATDAIEETVKKTEAPDLVALLGLSQDEAIKKLRRGATVTSTREVKEEGNPIKTNLTVALTEEPADIRTGTPTVYLGLDETGAVIQAGYSASTTALGYGSLSFSDAVKNEHIVEKTLQEAGIDVTEGAAVLPADRAEYSTYASDKTTLIKENCPFSGSVDVDGVPHEWSAVLSYDYSAANTSGNLANTIRIIYVYINA